MISTVCIYFLTTIGFMGRWQSGSAERLVEAAIELFGRNGFDQTTAEDIAKEAGLTERTFFRYFSDKREVLFYGADELKEHIKTLLLDAPLDVAPLEAVVGALEKAGRIFDERRDFVKKRQTVIASNPELLERELLKLDGISASMADTLINRGVVEQVATVTAEVGMTIFKIAMRNWAVSGGEKALSDTMRGLVEDLRRYWML